MILFPVWQRISNLIPLGNTAHLRLAGLVGVVIATFVTRLPYALSRIVELQGNRGWPNEPELAAIQLATRGILGNIFICETGPTALVSPLHPGILAGIYSILGVDTFSALLVQSFLGLSFTAASFAMLPILAPRLGLSGMAGWSAAWALALVPVNASYESFGDWEQPITVVVLLSLLLCALELARTRWQRMDIVAIAGVLTGLLALLTPSALPVLVFVIALQWRQGVLETRLIPSRVGVLALVAAILVAPWVIRNYSVFGAFIPFRSNLGLELAMGNADGATGKSYVVAHPHADRGECDRLLRHGEVAYMKLRQQETIDWISSHPGRFLQLTAARIKMFWFPGTEMYGTSKLLNAIKGGILTAMTILAFFGLGLLLRRGQQNGWLIAAFIAAPAAIYMITHVELRYRLPINALLALLAAEFCVFAWHWADAARAQIRKSSISS